MRIRIVVRATTERMRYIPKTFGKDNQFELEIARVFSRS